MTSVGPSGKICDPSAEDMELIATIAAEDAGIVIGPGKSGLVQSRLAGRLRHLGLADYTSYLARVSSADGGSERRELVWALTTNVSQFFREAHHFDALETTILPPLIARARAGGRVRFWSAGCARGQEAHSIAMAVLAAEPRAASLDIRILGTDIDPRMIAAGRAARYAADEVAQIPARHRQSLATAGPDGPTLPPDVTGMVRFHELNLHDPWPMTGPFDVIFCRNVVIYFGPDTQRRLWPRFAGMLAPGGWLLVGHSERVPTGGTSRFETAGVTTYRLRDLESHPSGKNHQGMAAPCR